MKLLSFIALASVCSIQALAEWSIVDLPQTTREDICVRQMAYCSNNCGGPTEAPKNFCNSKTMGWGCGCKSKQPDFLPYNWPIVDEECKGKRLACQDKCNSSTDDSRNQCYSDCGTNFQCGTDKAPPSYLEVPDEQTTPLYTQAYSSSTSTPTETPTSTSTSTPSDSNGSTSGSATNIIGMGGIAAALLTYAINI